MTISAPPPRYPPKRAKQMKIEQAQLAAGLKAVKHAMGKTFARPQLMGVHIRVKDNLATFTATDGSRLARYIGEGTGEGELLVKTEEIPDLLTGTNTLGDIELSRRESLSFPNVEFLFNKFGPDWATVPRKELIEMISEIRKTSPGDAEDKRVPIVIGFSGNAFQVKGRASTVAGILPGANYPDRQFAVNSKFLLALLRAGKGRDVLFNSTGATMVEGELKGANPTIVAFLGQPNFTGIVMPLIVKFAIFATEGTE